LRAQIKGKGRAALEAFAASVERLESCKSESALVALTRVIDEIGYFKWLESSAEPGEVDRAANVEELVTYAADYDESNPDGGLRGFLQDIALVSDSDAYSAGESKVTMMSLHAAKGLEFPCVFIAGLEEELLPHVRAITDAADPELAIEEERRLFYVGMTRAQDRLFLSRAVVRRHFGQQSYTSPSRFLAELPPESIRGFEADADEDQMLGRFSEAEAEQLQFSVGEYVAHAEFGTGRVLRLSGAGANARATVLFEQRNEKTLLLIYAKLSRVEGRGR
ncbi:MAG: 3'-5' exonuclease, partial [Planctomycetota bacterium]